MQERLYFKSRKPYKQKPSLYDTNEKVISVRKVRQAIFHRCYRKK